MEVSSELCGAKDIFSSFFLRSEAEWVISLSLRIICPSIESGAREVMFHQCKCIIVNDLKRWRGSPEE